MNYEVVETFCYLFADSEGLPIGKLDICRRLSIALGAARGECIFLES